MAITLVQHSGASTTSSSGGTITLAPSWGSTTTANNLLVCIVGVQSAGPTPVATITPESGWTLAVSSTCDLGNGGGRHRLSIYYIENASARSGTSTWTSSGGYMGSAKAAIALLEYSGVATSSSLDKTATGAAATNGSGINPYTNDTSATTGTTATTTQANELFIGGLMSTQGLSSITNSFTAEESRLTGTCFVAADKIVSSTGTANFAMTESAAGCFAGAIATFKAATASAFSHTASGGLTLSGSSLCRVRIPTVASGGMSFGGSATCRYSTVTNISGAGGMTFGGSADTSYGIVYDIEGAGGMVFGGSCVAYISFDLAGAGGMTWGGSATVTLVAPVEGAGGFAMGGASKYRIANDRIVWAEQ